MYPASWTTCKCLGRLPHQGHPVAVELFALADDQRVQARSIKELHHQELLTLAGHAISQGSHDPGVIEQHGNLALRRLIKPPESHFKLLGLLLVEDFESDDLVGLAVASLVEIGHRARNGIAQDLVPLGNVDLATVEDRLEKRADAHAGTCSPISNLSLYWQPLIYHSTNSPDKKRAIYRSRWWLSDSHDAPG